jgi:rare lipoprotein A
MKKWPLFACFVPHNLSCCCPRCVGLRAHDPLRDYDDQQLTLGVASPVSAMPPSRLVWAAFFPGRFAEPSVREARAFASGLHSTAAWSILRPAFADPFGRMDPFRASKVTYGLLHDSRRCDSVACRVSLVSSEGKDGGRLPEGGPDVARGRSFSRLDARGRSSARAQAVGEKETGLAAVYSDALHGRVTASGQTYDRAKLTAAHKTLPYGTRIKVTNPRNNRSVILRVNDRGPVQAGRILDISPAAAAHLGLSRRVMREVTLEVVEVGNGRTTRQHSR